MLFSFYFSIFYKVSISAENVLTEEHVSYQPREERKHWDIYYLRTAGYSYDDIASIVERVKKTTSPLTNKLIARIHKSMRDARDCLRGPWEIIQSYHTAVWD